MEICYLSAGLFYPLSPALHSPGNPAQIGRNPLLLFFQPNLIN